jgi:hypothetical protein
MKLEKTAYVKCRVWGGYAQGCIKTCRSQVLWLVGLEVRKADNQTDRQLRKNHLICSGVPGMSISTKILSSSI